MFVENKIENLIEEALSKKSKNQTQLELFNDLAKKDNLDVGYVHTNIGQDNSFFLTNKDLQRQKHELNNPNFITKWVETKNPALIRQRKKMLKLLTQAETEAGNTKDGMVVMGTGKNFGNSPEVLAHEMAHAVNHRDNKFLSPLRNKNTVAAANVGAIALAASGNPLPAAALIAAGHSGTLYDEGKASINGYKNLKEMGKKPKKKKLLTGFASYALAPIMPAFAVGRLTLARDEVNNLGYQPMIGHYSRGVLEQ